LVINKFVVLKYVIVYIRNIKNIKICNRLLMIVLIMISSNFYFYIRLIPFILSSVFNKKITFLNIPLLINFLKIFPRLDNALSKTALLKPSYFPSQIGRAHV